MTFVRLTTSIIQSTRRDHCFHFQDFGGWGLRLRAGREGVGGWGWGCEVGVGCGGWGLEAGEGGWGLKAGEGGWGLGAGR